MSGRQGGGNVDRPQARGSAGAGPIQEGGRKLKKKCFLYD
jgi:hypothetical protein